MSTVQNAIKHGLVDAIGPLHPSLQYRDCTSIRVSIVSKDKIRATKEMVLQYTTADLGPNSRLRLLPDNFTIWNNYLNLVHIYVHQDCLFVQIPVVTMQLLSDLDNEKYDLEHSVRYDGVVTDSFYICPLTRNNPWYIEFPRTCAFDHPTEMQELIQDIRECTTLMTKTLTPLLLCTTT